MRIVFVGAGDTSVKTAKMLIERGHEVVIIDENSETLENLADQLDCSFLQGDGSKPQILEEAGPELTDFLFCLSGSDQDNIIASLVGRSLGFSRVVTRIEDGAFETVCHELGLEDVVVPSRTISRHLADMTEGRTTFELSSMIKDDARLFTFIATEDDAGELSSLELPDGATVICCYRDQRFMLADRDETLREGDEVIILSHSKNLDDLRERWKPVQAKKKDDDED